MPSSGTVAYDGDHDYDGDSLSFNGTRLVDGTSGSDNNFFNSSAHLLGQAHDARVGDMPQLSGDAGQHDRDSTSTWSMSRRM
jgi:hypothetical protein